VLLIVGGLPLNFNFKICISCSPLFQCHVSMLVWIVICKFFTSVDVCVWGGGSEGGTTMSLCDHDMWSYFKALNGLKGLGHVEMKELWYYIGGGSVFT